MKTLKFKPDLVPLVLSGEKNSTWRLFDDKDLKEGDELQFINSEANKEFAIAKIISTREKKLKNLDNVDFDGHEKFESQERMYEAFRNYYGDKVTQESIVKIIKFKLR